MASFGKQFQDLIAAAPNDVLRMELTMLATKWGMMDQKPTSMTKMLAGDDK